VDGGSTPGQFDEVQPSRPAVDGTVSQTCEQNAVVMVVTHDPCLDVFDHTPETGWQFAGAL
jgi:hypothetical protein